MTVDTARLVEIVTAAEPTFLSFLETLVGIDCGSYDPVGVNRVADLVQARFAAGGWQVARHADPTGATGDVLVATRPGTNPAGRRVVLAAHLDTVFETGAATERPYRLEQTPDGRRAYGPGVCDDKAGLLAGLHAAEAVVEAGLDGYAQLTVICSPDEEIGSPFSKPFLAQLGRDNDVALCLECARANGDLVTARKGCVDLVVELTGRAAHSGIEPEKGINAALAAARLTVSLQQLNGQWPGVTVNVGVVRAGTRPNIVASHAVLEVDIRSTDRVSAAAVLAEAERRATDPDVLGIEGVTVTLGRTADVGPMEVTPAWLLTAAQEVGRAVGVTVVGAHTGGAADANTLAAAGCATLDGLGPVGGNDHAPTEYLDVESVVPRTALLAGLIAAVAAADVEHH